MQGGLVRDGRPAQAHEVGRTLPDTMSPPVGGVHLKRLLKALDVMGLAAGWWLAYVVMVAVGAANPPDTLRLAGLGVVGIAAALSVMASKRLWLARVCAVRTAELEGIGQAAILSALVVLAVGQVTDHDAPDRSPCSAGCSASRWS